MLRFLMLVVALCLVLGLTFWLSRPAPPPETVRSENRGEGSTQPMPPSTQRHLAHIDIVAGKRVAGPAVIRLTQGDELALTVSSDRDGELHLHGYDRHLGLKAGDTVTLSLTADISGRFTYELHGAAHHDALGAIEVMPR